nr:hypothetical protein [Tanacetum cinerariifolium]
MESPEVLTFSDDFDSACSTPFVSAPSSPGRTSYANGAVGGGGFFYSAPASPIHFMISSSSSSKTGSLTSPEPSGAFQFETERETLTSESMTSADELFLNGQIRPMRHLQVLSPLLDIDNENENDDDVTNDVRGREHLGSIRSKSLRRRARSMSPLRNNSNTFEWFPTEINEIKQEEDNNNNNNNNTNNNNDKDKSSEMETTPSGASSRSSSVGRSSKRWVFLKEFLYRSKSEGRTSTSTSHGHGNSNGNSNIKFWTSLSFSPNKEKKLSDENFAGVKGKGKVSGDGNVTAKKAVNGVSNRRVGGRSAHEVHYTMNRAQAEEMRRKTYLPYKQGLLGCLGFSSKSYGAMNGFARALNPVSSR